MSVLAIGIGLATSATAEEIVRFVSAALKGLPQANHRALFTRDSRLTPALTSAAQQLGLPVIGLPDFLLNAAQSRVPNPSCKVKAASGLSSVAEAAALAGAGSKAKLLVEKSVGDKVTIAIAYQEGGF